MGKRIVTANLNIDPELCKRMDAAIYSTLKSAPKAIIDRANVYRSELVELIHNYNQHIAEIERNAGLYHLCCIAERLAADWAEHDHERGRSNAQTARTQLANWK